MNGVCDLLWPSSSPTEPYSDMGMGLVARNLGGREENVVEPTTRTRLCWQRKKKRQAISIKMGRASALGLRHAACEPASGHPPSEGPAPHLWGISLPGAFEGLCHLRGTIEPMVANGTLQHRSESVTSLSTGARS